MLFRDQGGALAAEVRHGGVAAAKWVTRTITDNESVNRKWRDRVLDKNNSRDYCHLDRRKNKEGPNGEKEKSRGKKED
jgi:hypothetical protein